MKIFKFGLLFLLLFVSLIAGFLSSYSVVVVALILLLLFNLVQFFLQNDKIKLKLRFFAISCIAFFAFYHVGLLVKTNFSPVCYEGIPKNFKDSEFNLRPLDLIDLEKQIALFSDFKTDTLGKVVFENSDYYIKKLVSDNKASGKKKILIVAGTHGSETANVYAIPVILSHIKSQKLLSDFYFEIVYALNPVGLSLFHRHNECNCNVNRDFISFKTVQSRLLRNLVSETNFDCVLDLHEGPYDGQYIINNTSYKSLETKIISGLEKKQIEVSPMMKNRMRDFIFQYEIDNPVAKLKKISTFDIYLKSKGIQNILSESDGLSVNFDDRIQGHVEVFDQVIQAMKSR